MMYSLPPLRTLCAVAFLAMGYLLAGGFAQDAYAANGTSTTCASGYGITVRVMDCVEQAICNAVVGTNCDGSADTTSGSTSGNYLSTVSTGLSSYFWAAATLSFVLFGIKLLGTDKAYAQQSKIISDSATVLFRFAIAWYLVSSTNGVSNASSLFLTFINSIGEMIGWVTGSSGSGSGSSATYLLGTFTNICTVDSATPPTGMDIGQYNVWKVYDCLLSQLVGAATSAQGISTSLAVILLPALFTGIFCKLPAGVLIFFFGVSAICFAVSVAMRALYVVLLSYISVGFLMLFTPLFAPLLMFKGHPSKLFEQWFMQIIAVVIQPVIIVAFVAFSIAVADQFIEGNISGCTVGTATSVCSLNQLASGNASATASSSINFGSSFIDPNGINTVAWLITGDPKGNVDANSGIFKQAINKVLQIAAGTISSALNIPNLPSLNVSTSSQTTILAQMALTLGTFLFLCFIFRHLLEVIDQIAASIIPNAQSIPLAMAALPLGKILTAAISGAKSGMLNAAQSIGNAKGGMGTIMRAGGEGFARGAAVGFVADMGVGSGGGRDGDSGGDSGDDDSESSDNG